ncbi:HAD family hydrolase, partial [Candidatus Saccharibacteria bacterium]|nr:HAD family hydrolase [Candidatus Saccharibacteria bacterium]
MSDLCLMDFEALALDFDGTLASSNGVHTEARQQAYMMMAEEDPRFGEVSDEIHGMAYLYGSHPEEINAWILAQAGIIESASDVENPQVREVVSLKNEVYRKIIAAGLDPQPGAIEFVRRVFVRRAGKVAIVSTAYPNEVYPYLRRHKIDKYFPDSRLVLRGHPDVANLKPAPDAYQASMDILNVRKPENLLVIEDSAEGIESAKRAGATVVAVATTRSVDALLDLEGHQQPDAILRD